MLLLAACSDTPRLQPLSAEATILALGDSLTYGTGANEAQSYPAILQALTGRSVINAGIPGETSDKTLMRLEEVLDEYQPELVILCIGGNDILQRRSEASIRQNIQQIIDKIKQQNRQLVLVAVPEFGLYPAAPELYQQLAENNQIPLDNETIPHVLRSPSLKSDAIHGNQAGYREIAEAIYQLLKESGAITT